jgi:hypothetical protein
MRRFGWSKWKKNSDATLWWAKYNEVAADYWFSDGTKVSANAVEWFITADPLPDAGPDTPGAVSVITNAALTAGYAAFV